MTAPIADTTWCDDADDFSAFYATWRPRLTSYVARRFGLRDVDEIVQETFVRALTHFHELRRDEPWGWLSKVARNIGCDLRRQDPRNAPADPVVLEAIVDSERGPEETLIGSEIRRQISAALGMLRPDERQLLTMQAIDGLSIGEMADVLATTEGAVRARLFRARRRLSVWFEGVGGAAALSPLPLVMAAVRRLRRLVAPSAAPALAAFSGLVAVTAVLGATNVMPSFGHADATVAPMPAVEQAAATQLNEPTPPAYRPALATSRPSGTAGTSTTAAAPEMLSASAPGVNVRVTKDLKKRGELHDVDMTIPMPVGQPVHVVADGVLDDDPNPASCAPAISLCTP